MAKLYERDYDEGISVKKKNNNEVPQSCQEKLPWLESCHMGNIALKGRNIWVLQTIIFSSEILCPKFYSLIHLVALNKIVWNMHQEQKCLPMLLLSLLKHTQLCAQVPEPNVCIFQMFIWVSRTL